jgi:choline-sulfatase
MKHPNADPDRMVKLPGAPGLIMGGIYPLADGEITPSTNLANEAMQWLDAETSGSEPWMLRVSFVDPHTPVMPPKRFADMFDPNDFAFDPEKDQPHEGMSAYERLIADAQETAGLTSEQIAYARSDYWGLVSHVDDEVGRILKRLNELGLESNTIVVFDSDHGTLLAEMGLWQKQMYNRAIHRVPQIISCPGRLPQGEQRDDLNELLDRGATLMSLCGVERPDGFRGRGLFGGEPDPEAVYGVIGYGEPGSLVYPLVGAGPVAPRRACVRTQEYRYSASIRYEGKDIPAGDPERAPSLIDIANDPEERSNVSGDPRFVEAESRMERLLEKWLEMDGMATVDS